VTTFCSPGEKFCYQFFNNWCPYFAENSFRFFSHGRFSVARFGVLRSERMFDHNSSASISNLVVVPVFPNPRCFAIGRWMGQYHVSSTASAPQRVCFSSIS
jgi:hypothetical protein